MRSLVCFGGIALLLFGSCGSSPDVAVTETGNPTQISLSYRADTLTGGLPKCAAKRSAVSAVTVTKAVIVVVEVALESSTRLDSLLFESERPYLLDLDLGGQSILLDTMSVVGGGVYDELEIAVEQLEDAALHGLDPHLQGRSMRIEGYCSGDSLQTFVFESQLDMDIVSSFEVPVDLADGADHNVIIELDMSTWFTDSSGGYLDPRLAANREKIEESIVASFTVLDER